MNNQEEDYSKQHVFRYIMFVYSKPSSRIEEAGQKYDMLKLHEQHIKMQAQLKQNPRRILELSLKQIK